MPPLAKGAGHFEETSIWCGNIAIAGHNRGPHGIFGDLHTLRPGDKIVLTTRLGTRTYSVTSVSKVHETERPGCFGGGPAHPLYLRPGPERLPLVCAGGACVICPIFYAISLSFCSRLPHRFLVS